jgi:hypothetical protein
MKKKTEKEEARKKKTNDPNGLIDHLEFQKDESERKEYKKKFEQITPKTFST